MSTDKDKKKEQPSSSGDKTKAYEKEYPDNGDNFSAGGDDDTDGLPNNPAENAERKGPKEKTTKPKEEEEKP